MYVADPMRIIKSGEVNIGRTGSVIFYIAVIDIIPDKEVIIFKTAVFIYRKETILWCLINRSIPSIIEYIFKCYVIDMAPNRICRIEAFVYTQNHYLSPFNPRNTDWCV